MTPTPQPPAPQRPPLPPADPRRGWAIDSTPLPTRPAPPVHTPVQQPPLLLQLARSTVRIVAGAARLTWAQRLPIVLTVGYLALGLYLVLHADMYVLDSLSRSAHAYFVWNNDPAKLSALGFVWGPVLTLPMVPFAAVEVIGRSGMSAVLVAAPVMAAAVTIAWRQGRAWGGGVWAAAGLGALLVHPMLLYYGANGMSEAWAVLMPTIVLVCLLRWHDDRSISMLGIAGFAAALGTLARYELAAVSALLVLSVLGVVATEERNWPKARALALFSALPTLYLLAAWMYFNWAVQGSAIWFLTDGGQIATASGTASTVGSSGELGLLEGVARVVSIQVQLMPAIVPVLAGLVVWAAWRRSFLALAAAVLVGYNLLSSATLVAVSGTDWMTNIRFNMRAIPLVVVGGLWLAAQLRAAGLPRLRLALLSCWAFGLLLAVPTSARLMERAPVQFYEAAFIDAVARGEVVSGREFGDGDLLQSCRGAKAMGAWVERNVRSRDSIIADDASMFAVMMFSGHPERFVDSIDRGSTYLVDQLSRPSARVRHVLVSDFTDCAGVDRDLVTQRFGPDTFHEGAPGLALEHAEHGFRLYRIADRAELARTALELERVPAEIGADIDGGPS